jgi:hypothetical protein
MSKSKNAETLEERQSVATFLLNTANSYYRPLNETIATLRENTKDHSLGYSLYKCTVSATLLDFIPFAYIVKLDSGMDPINLLKGVTDKLTINKPLSLTAASAAFITCVAGTEAQNFALQLNLSDENTARALTTISTIQTGVKYATRSAAFSYITADNMALAVEGIRFAKGIFNGAAYNAPLPFGYSGITTPFAFLIEAIDNGLNFFINRIKPEKGFNIYNKFYDGILVGGYVSLVVIKLGFIFSKDSYNNLVSALQTTKEILEIGYSTIANFFASENESGEESILTAISKPTPSPTTSPAGDIKPEEMEL